MQQPTNNTPKAVPDVDPALKKKVLDEAADLQRAGWSYRRTARFLKKKYNLLIN